MSSLAERVRAALAADGPIADEVPGFAPRPGQVAMAERVAQALEDDERLLCEAGTGTGKTLAYLVPAVLSGRKVIVSTGTKTLQDQIARIDLPRLAAALPERFSFSVMKGLANYVCLRRLGERARQATLPGFQDPHLARILSFVERTPTGDRADLPDVPEESPSWREVVATPETRLGSRCPYFDRCFVTAMRRRAVEAQIVVVNHHLYLADMALRARWPEAQVLPPHEVVIFDEAHQLEEIATEFFGIQVSTQRLFALARDVGRAPIPEPLGARAQALGHHVETATEALASALRARLPGPREGGEETRVELPPDLLEGPDARGRYHALDAVLEETASFLARVASDGLPELVGPGRRLAPEVTAVLEGLAGRAVAIRNDLGRMAAPKSRHEVRWVAIGARHLTLRSSPVDVGPTLGRLFDDHPGPLVFTSATLRVGESFEYARERLGLRDAAAESVFPSPFRWSEQALLYLPSDLPDPTDERFAEATAERMVELCALSRGRALLLFTSFRNLRAAEAKLRADGRFPLLVQGERPRHMLLEALKTNVGSVLLASQSFWEGVDVPGEALSLVVIDRIPFAVPDEPLVAAKIARLREEGADPFGSYQLPHAALALRQGTGRLVRTTRDRGVVAILDGRLARRSYGPSLLANLPRGTPRTEDLEDVARYFGPADASLI